MNTHSLNLNLADIKAFVEIADSGSFTQAAEHLGVSRSHVSRQLSALEKHMGVSLMLRTTRSLRLTEAGHGFYQRAKKSLLELNQAVAETIDNSENIRGTIKLNCVGGPIGEDLIAKLASEFMLQYPEIVIELDFSSHRIDLISEHFDIAFRMGELDDASFVGKKLCDLKIETLASPQLLTQFPDLSSPKELEHIPCLTGSVTQWKFQHKDDPSKTLEIPVTGRLNCKSGRALVQGAIAGNGVIRVPIMYCPNEIAEGKLLPAFESWQIPLVPFYAIFHKERYQPARLRAFIDYISDHFSSSIKAAVE